TAPARHEVHRSGGCLPGFGAFPLAAGGAGSRRATESNSDWRRSTRRHTHGRLPRRVLLHEGLPVAFKGSSVTFEGRPVAFKGRCLAFERPVAFEGRPVGPGEWHGDGPGHYE